MKRRVLPPQLPENSVSPFARQCLSRIALPKRARVLDVPCGFGRHSVWLTRMGHAITAVDVEPTRVDAAEKALSELPGKHSYRCIPADAEKPLPLEPGTLDLAIVIHYYAANIFETVAEVLKPGGVLIFETFGAQGNNWRSLPETGLAEKLLRSQFDALDIHERSCGPGKSNAVVQALAIRRE